MKRPLLAAILFAAYLPHAYAKAGLHEPFEVSGSVIKNHDGDTITLRTDDRGVINVRLSGADTPETGQAYWRVARDRLYQLISDKPVTVSCYKQDWRKREVCHVSVDGTDPALVLVKQGLAWYVRIPAQVGHGFQSKLDSDSDGSWTPIPGQAGQPEVIA